MPDPEQVYVRLQHESNVYKPDWARSLAEHESDALLAIMLRGDRNREFYRNVEILG